MIEAFELKRQGCYKQSIELYYKLLSETEDNIEILTELADLYFLMKNNSKAEHYINKVLELNPQHIEALNLLKKVFVANGDINLAIEVAQKVYKISESENSLYLLLELLYDNKFYDKICEYSVSDTNKEALFIKAKAFYRLAKFQDSLKLLENIGDTVEEDKLLLLGKIYYKTNMVEKVKEVYKKLKELDLTNPESLNFVGLNYIDEQDFDKAIECFKKAISLKADEAKYHYNLGQAYFLKGWTEEAGKSFNTAICLNPMEESYHYSLAYLLYRTGDYENALIHLESDKDSSEEYLNSKILKLIIKAEKGDLAIPKIELEKLLVNNPKNETILFALAKIYFKLDMYKQSKTIMEEILEINKKSFEYKEFYVRLLLQLKELDEAKSVIDEMSAKSPNYYYAKVLEAEYTLLLENYDRLYEIAQDLIELDLNHYEGYYYNAEALFEKGDTSFAIESLKKAITLDVNNANLYIKMAEFYQVLGKYEDSFEYIKEACDIDKSAKNKELYMKLSSIVRKRSVETQE